MTYATQQGLVERFGETELVQLSDRDGDRQADADVIARALADADAEINARLAVRYALPLAPSPDGVPDKITAIAHDLARHNLMKGNGVTVDAIVKAADVAIAFLRDLAAGKAQLDLPLSGTAVPTTGGPRFDGPCRTFTDDTLKGF